MYAVVVDAEISDVAQATAELNDQVIPGLSSRPGFISGVWVGLDAESGHSITVWETEEQAQAFSHGVQQVAPSAVTIVKARVGEVRGSAGLSSGNAA